MDRQDNSSGYEGRLPRIARDQPLQRQNILEQEQVHRLDQEGALLAYNLGDEERAQLFMDRPETQPNSDVLDLRVGTYHPNYRPQQDSDVLDLRVGTYHPNYRPQQEPDVLDLRVGTYHPNYRPQQEPDVLDLRVGTYHPNYRPQQESDVLDLRLGTYHPNYRPQQDSDVLDSRIGAQANTGLSDFADNSLTGDLPLLSEGFYSNDVAQGEPSVPSQSLLPSFDRNAENSSRSALSQLNNSGQPSPIPSLTSWPELLFESSPQPSLQESGFDQRNVGHSMPIPIGMNWNYRLPDLPDSEYDPLHFGRSMPITSQEASFSERQSNNSSLHPSFRQSVSVPQNFMHSMPMVTERTSPGQFFQNGSPEPLSSPGDFGSRGVKRSMPMTSDSSWPGRPFENSPPQSTFRQGELNQQNPAPSVSNVPEADSWAENLFESSLAQPLFFNDHLGSQNAGSSIWPERRFEISPSESLSRRGAARQQHTSPPGSTAQSFRTTSQPSQTLGREPELVQFSRNMRRRMDQAGSSAAHASMGAQAAAFLDSVGVAAGSSAAHANRHNFAQAEDNMIQPGQLPPEPPALSSRRTVTGNYSQRAWSSEEVARLRELGKNGMTWEETAIHFPGRSKLALTKKWSTMYPNEERSSHPWTEEEDARLKQFVASCNNSMQQVSLNMPGRTMNAVRNRWEIIRGEGIQRDTSRRKRRWTEQEDQALIDLVYNHGSNWSAIAAGMPGRSVHSLKRRYLTLRSESGPHRQAFEAQWTEEEDRTLTQLVESYGTDFKEMGGFMPNKSVISMKQRWEYLKSHDRKRKLYAYTKEEDEKLLSLVTKYGTIWPVIHTHFPTRTQLALRGRYRLLKEKMNR